VIEDGWSVVDFLLDGGFFDCLIGFSDFSDFSNFKFSNSLELVLIDDLIFSMILSSSV